MKNDSVSSPARPPQSKYLARAPAFHPPPLSCDAHVHIFGPAARFPYVGDRRYTPQDTPKEDLAALHAALGIERSVLVQATCHGTDNRAMLDALEWGRGRYRGVALLDGSESDEQLQRFARAGVRGVRFNFLRHLGGAPDHGLMRRTIERITPLGWHVQLHFDASGLIEFNELIRSIRIPFIIDHIGRTPVQDGIDQPPLKALLDLQRLPNCWVKVSGADRITVTGSPYHDAVPFLKAVVDRAPNRVVWGSDFPHPMLKLPQDNAALVDLIPFFVPDPATQKMLLVDNPARFYEF